MTWRTRWRLVLSLAFMTAGALAMLAVAIATLFRARRFYSEVIGAFIGRATLRIWGIRFVVHHAEPLPRRQAIFVSNHPSTLDVFILIGLALPRTRFFLSGFLRRMPPFAIVGTLIRIFWTVPQQYPDQRRRIFQRADRVLRDTGDSVYLSPEGTRVTTGEIGHFNKGSFHLATSLRAPIVPIYLRTPAAVNPGKGYAAGAGVVDVYFLPAIDTSAWRLEDLEENRDRVHELFVRVHAAMRQHGRLPRHLGIRELAPGMEVVA